MIRFIVSRSVHHVVSYMCLKSLRIVQVGTVEQYLEKGPGFIFLFHPALGPMWEVIAQKIRGGALMHGSELVLEVVTQVSQNHVLLLSFPSGYSQIQQLSVCYPLS